MSALTRITSLPKATSATNDEMLLQSWVASLQSKHSKRNFEQTGRRFLTALTWRPNASALQQATVEDVRDALDRICRSMAETTARQYVIRVKSLLSYAFELGYTQFNAGTVIKVRGENRGASIAKRIISEVEVSLLIRAAERLRDRTILTLLYTGGLRVSELVGLNCDDIVPRDGGMVQLTIRGKGGFIRNVLLPLDASKMMIRWFGDPHEAKEYDGPMFLNPHGQRITERAVNSMIKRVAKRAGLSSRISPHWLRHAHGSHALDNGATIAEVQETLGHRNASTTSGYLHARPDSSSGLKLDPGVFKTE